MRRRLLMLLSIFMMITSVGWMHAQEGGADAGFIKDQDGNYTVSTALGLQGALTELNAAKEKETVTITLAADLDISALKVMGGSGSTGEFQGMFYLANALTTNVTLTIDGQNHKIYGQNKTQGTTDSNTGAVIADYADKTYVFYGQGHGGAPVTFKNLTVTGTNIVGFNLYDMQNVMFDNLTVSDNAAGGIHLNSTVATATNLKTSGNKKFAIKLSRQMADLPGIALGEGCVMAETDVPQVGFFDRKAYNMDGDGGPATPTLTEFNAMVSGTVGTAMKRSYQMGLLHLSNNSKAVRVWQAANVAKVSKVEELEAIFADGFATVGAVKLATGAYTLTSGLMITKPISIIGDEGTILTTTDFADNLVTIKSTENVRLEKLTIKGAKKSGLHVYKSTNVSLENVTLADNANAGLIVNGSTVDAKSLATSGNGWGGVNVDKGQLVTNTPHFTFDAASTFAEAAQIWSELAGDDVKALVDAPDGWNGSVAPDGKCYWTNVAKALTYEFYQIFPNKGSNAGYAFIYANGHPVTITEGSSADKVKISVDGTDESLEVESSKNPYIFGGSKNGNVASSQITMKSGTVSSIMGGGYGEVTASKPAEVTGTTTINVTGGKAHNIIGGGLYFAKSNLVNLTISGVTMDYNAWVICGGLESGKTKGDAYPTFDKAGNTVNKANLTITGGTFCYVAIGGTDGNKGYIKESSAAISNATLVGIFGNGSNGASDNVEGILTDCTFKTIANEKGEALPIEIASINRGHAKNITFSFNNCIFPEKVDAYIGGTIKWKDGYQSSQVAFVNPGKVSFSFDDKCTNTPVLGLSDGLDAANVTVDGAKVNVLSFNNGVDAAKIAFTINKDYTWAFNDGITIDKACTLTNNGTLILPASDIMAAGVAAGGVLKVNATIEATKTELDKATKEAKTALMAKDITITCTDGVIATTEATAKALAKQGIVVKLLKNTEGILSFGEIDLSDPKITSLPSKVTFGTSPIALVTNHKVKSITVTEGGEFAAIKEGTDGAPASLEIKKPGDVVLTLTVKTEGEEGESKTYAQNLTIEKKTISLVEGLSVEARGYNGNNEVDVKIETVKLQGVVEGQMAEISQSGTVKGQMADANAGENKAVTFAASAFTLKTGGEYYQLAPVTFVTATINKKALTVTAKAKSGSLERDFGKANPEFDVDYSGFENSESVSVLEGILKFDCPATETSLAGTYKVTPKGLTSKNYNLTFTAADLTVKAVAPTVETTSVVVGADKKITMTGKLVDRGGAAANATVTVSFDINGSQKAATSVSATLKADNTFAATSDVLIADTYSVQAKAQIGDNSGTGKAFSATISEDKPQTVEFVSVLSKIVYGSADIQLEAKSNAAGATFKYAAEDNEDDVIAVTEAGKLSVKNAGKATIKVTATATGYVTTSTYQTIEVTPKPLQANLTNAAALTKVYDGKTDLATQPVYTLAGIVGQDVVSLEKIEGARFASKDAGKQTILLPELKLTDDAAANYKLATVANPTGEITKSKVTIAVDPVTRMWNDKYTQYAFTWTGFVAGESEKTPGIYTGQLKVEESSLTDQGTYQTGTLGLSTSTIALKNYTVEYMNSTVTVNKGNPVAIVYGQATTKATSGLNTKLVDQAGYTDLKVEDPIAGEYALIKDANGNVVGQTINKVASAQSTVISLSASFNMPVVTKAGTAFSNWNTDNKAAYLDELTLAKAGNNMSYESTNPDILAITGIDAATGVVTCQANGVGTVAILATNTQTYEVQFMYFEVAPKTVYAVPASAYTKTYDGTTLASGLTPVLKDAKANGADLTDDIALNTEGITFNFAQAKAGSGNVTPSQELILTGSKKNNYLLDVTGLGGIISKAELAITSPISKYYDGSKDVTMTDYTATGLAEGAIVPVKATFESANVGAEVGVSIALANDADKANYDLQALAGDAKGAILKSTYVATLPSSATASTAIAQKVTFTIAETNAAVAAGKAAGYAPTIAASGSKFYVSGGDNDNYSVVYTSNSVTKSNPVIPPVDPEDPTVVEGVSLDITAKVLPRTESFILTATVTPADAENKKISWKSSDEAIVKIESTGDFTAKVTALAVGEATITVTTEDGAKTATCEVTVDFATGLEEAIANTRVYASEGAICIEPVMPMDVTVVNMTGRLVYKNAISSNTTVTVSGSGVYLVKLGNGNEAKVYKVNVR